MRIVITDCDLPADGRMERVLEDAGHEVARYACRTEEEVLAVVGDADGLLVQWAPITEAVLDHASGCRVISRLGIGYDMIDVTAATARSVLVANTPDYCVEEVALHSVAMLLHLVRGLGALDAVVRDGGWSVVQAAPNAVRAEATPVLVVGLGRIGSRTAAMLGALGFDVLVHDPYATERIAAEGWTSVGLEEGLATAAAVTLHVPLTDATRHLLDAEALAAARPGIAVVNTCRGGLIDEDALVAAVRSGQVGGAALDVFESEPLPPDSPLRDTPGILLTPHAAWYSPQALADLPIRAAENVVDFFDGRPVASAVNAGVASALD